MVNRKDSQKKMDGNTAMAFAGHRFEELHPKDTWPEWFRKGVVSSYSITRAGNYVVVLAVTLKSTKAADVFFKVEVDHLNGNTNVLIDRPVETYNPGELVFEIVNHTIQNQ